MAEKVSAELTKHLEEIRETDQGGDVPVIVTVTGGTDSAVLEKAGLRIQHTFPSISALSGVASADAIEEIAELDAVVKVEYDGGMRAL